MKTPIIIDLEASGFGKGSYPIEVGYVDEAGSTWCALVMPSADCTHWDNAAEKLHQISRKMLTEKGRPPTELAQHLNRVFRHQVVYTDAWYQDFTWMNRLYEMAGMQPNFKIEDIRTILTPYQLSIWHETKEAITEKQALKRHRASTDALIIQLTWKKTAASETVQAA